MKKRIFNTGALKAFRKEISNNFSIMFLPSINKIRSVLNAHPKLTVFCMTLMLSANLCLLFFFNKKTKSAYNITDIYTGKVVNDQFPEIKQNIPFTISNFIQMSEIRDSLEILMHKKIQEPEDTTTLLRLFEKYQKLDTSFKIK